MLAQDDLLRGIPPHKADILRHVTVDSTCLFSIVSMTVRFSEGLYTILWRWFLVQFSTLCLSYTPIICYPEGPIQVDAYSMKHLIILETDMTLEDLLPFIRQLSLRFAFSGTRTILTGD